MKNQKTEEYNKEMENLTERIKIQPTDHNLYYIRGRLLRKKGEYQKSIDDFNRAIDLKPPNSDRIFVARGCSWEDLKEYELALKDYNKALEINPENCLALFNRGLLFSKIQSEFMKAIDDFTCAINSFSKNVNFPKADQKKNETAVLEKQLSDCYFNRGLVFEKLKEHQKSLYDFHEAMIYDPTNEKKRNVFSEMTLRLRRNSQTEPPTEKESHFMKNSKTDQFIDQTSRKKIRKRNKKRIKRNIDHLSKVINSLEKKESSDTKSQVNEKKTIKHKNKKKKSIVINSKMRKKNEVANTNFSKKKMKNSSKSKKKEDAEIILVSNIGCSNNKSTEVENFQIQIKELKEQLEKLEIQKNQEIEKIEKINISKIQEKDEELKMIQVKHREEINSVQEKILREIENKKLISDQIISKKEEEIQSVKHENRKNMENKNSVITEIENKILMLEGTINERNNEIKGNLCELKNRDIELKNKINQIVSLKSSKKKLENFRISSEILKTISFEEEEKEQARLRNILKNKRFVDFTILKRLGTRTSKQNQSYSSRYYGTQGAVYLCSLNSENNDEIFAMKLVYNFNNRDDTKTIDQRLIQNEILDIPFHPNIAACLNPFVDEVNYDQLPNFDAEINYLARKTAIFIMKYYPRNLKSYISERKHNLGNIELLVKLEQLLDGICHLQKHNISHRDLKPDNVFVKNSSTLLIGDFGECYKGNLVFPFTKQMESYFPRGGASYYLAPEISKCRGGENMFIDYSKNDVFSVGLIGCKMIQEFVVYDSKYNFICLENENVEPRIIEFLKMMIAVDPLERLSCFEAKIRCSDLLRSLILEGRKSEKEEIEGENED